jgi:hypothetical protein
MTDEPLSKGAARRAAGDYSTPEVTKSWHRKLVTGLAGVHPALPNVRKGIVPRHQRANWLRRTIFRWRTRKFVHVGAIREDR